MPGATCRASTAPRNTPLTPPHGPATRVTRGAPIAALPGAPPPHPIGSITARAASREPNHRPPPPTPLSLALRCSHPASRCAARTPPRTPLSRRSHVLAAAARRARRPPPRRTCTPEAIASLNAFSRRFVADVTRPGGWLRAGNGAFVHSCCEHDALFKDRAWAEYASAAGGVPMREAIERWWRAPPSAPAAAHTHLPCALLAEPASRTHQCNPTCAAFERRGFSMMEAPPGLQQPELSEMRLVRQCRSHYVCRPEAVETEQVNKLYRYL